MPTVRLSIWKNSGSPGIVSGPPPTMNANVAGTMRPIVARIREAAFMPTTSWSYCCTPFLSPPTSSDAPSTSSRLPMIEPVIEAWTTSIFRRGSGTPR